MSQPADPRSVPRLPLAHRSIAVFGSSTLRDTAPAWTLAEDLGRELAAAGARVLNGGYGGVMEAVSRGAHAAGGCVVGVTVDVFPDREPNRFLSERKQTGTLLERLGILLQADGFVALEGSVGTLTEFFLVWNHVMLEAPPRRPLVCLGPAWSGLIATLREEKIVDAADLLGLVRLTEEPRAAVELLAKLLGDPCVPAAREARR